MTLAEIDALAAKYREMIALRNDAGEKDDARLRALAARFPGVLRELDTRTMASLESRLAELSSGSMPAWASVQSRFHGWLRVGLRMRADGATTIDAARAWRDRYAPMEPGDPITIDDAQIAVLVSPPNGRVSLAARALLDAGEIDLDVLLFGPE